MTIVTGDGEEFTAFFDGKKQSVAFRDIVACTLRSVSLFGEGIFIANNIRCFKDEGEGD